MNLILDDRNKSFEVYHYHSSIFVFLPFLQETSVQIINFGFVKGIFVIVFLGYHLVLRNIDKQNLVPILLNNNIYVLKQSLLVDELFTNNSYLNQIYARFCGLFDKNSFHQFELIQNLLF